MSVGGIVGVCFAGVIFVLLATWFVLIPKRAYFSALFSGAYVLGFKLIALKLRKAKTGEIVEAYIASKRGKLGIAFLQLETLCVAGGNPVKVVEALSVAKSAKIDIDFALAKAVDAAGMDVLGLVQACVNPTQIEIPLASAVAQDNREVTVKVTLTLKPVLSKYLDGVGEETLSARAVEAVVTKIANTAEAKNIIARPQLLDKAIYDAQIDEDSKYELVSADVIHVDYGVDRNIAKLQQQEEVAERRAKFSLEQRRLTATAVEAEMKAKAEEMRSRVIANEAEVPKAVVEAIQKGKMKDIVDYYKVQNLQADTEMRRKLSQKNDNEQR